jgi:hypothetical protein
MSDLVKEYAMRFLRKYKNERENLVLSFNGATLMANLIIERCQPRLSGWKY